MFDTLDEAVEMNSECAFCKKPKFKVISNYVDQGLEVQNYDLVRCALPECDMHCTFNHKNEPISLPDGRDPNDMLAIGSGWGGTTL